MRKLWLAGIVALGAIVARVEAEVVGTDPGNQDTTTPTSSTNTVISGYTDVGQVNGASGVYLGNDWVITADHVGAGNFALNGTTYTVVSGSATRLSSPDTYGTPSPVGADLLLFRVSGASALSDFTLASSEIADKQEIFSVGFGLSRPANEAATLYYISGSGSSTTWSTTASVSDTGSDGAFSESGGGVRMWGNNFVRSLIRSQSTGRSKGLSLSSIRTPHTTPRNSKSPWGILAAACSTIPTNSSGSTTPR
jgi:hypothetical protein